MKVRIPQTKVVTHAGATGYEMVPLPVWRNEKPKESFLDTDNFS